MMWKEMAYGDLPFPDTGCPVPAVYIYYVPDKINVWDTVSYIYPHPLDVSAHGHYFLNNGFENTEWTSCISDLHDKIRITSRRHQMETFSALLAIMAGDSPVTKPVTRSFDVFFVLRLNKRFHLMTSSCISNVSGQGKVITVTSHQCHDVNGK